MVGPKPLLRAGFEIAEGGLNRVFPVSWNPLCNLGAIGFFFYWIVAATGIYLYIFFDTSTTAAYQSVEQLTRDQWYLGGVMRSLHRYASEGLVLILAVHVAREFSLDRYRGKRWFTWITGIPITWFLIGSGITGYWLVWDELAQYVAEQTTEWLDWLPIFGKSIAVNFLAPSHLDDRFFTLLIFLHIALPLFLLLCLWLHINRVSRPAINPPRGLALGLFGMMIALSLIKPAISHAPANLARVPATLSLDWYYLAIYPLMERWSDGAVWGAVITLTLIVAVMPWMPPMRRAPVAVVDLANCNGCTRCEEDCPYAAITMLPRTDGGPFARQPVVNEARCVSCGICAGACPTGTPFRRESNLRPGIDLPHFTLRDLRERIHLLCETPTDERATPRVLVFGCDYAVGAARLKDPRIRFIGLPCIGMLPPSFIDYALSKNLADGVFLTGCRTGSCRHRLGQQWTQGRLAGTRDPALRGRVPRERLAWRWAASTEAAALEREIAAFADRIAVLSPPTPRGVPRLRMAAAGEAPAAERVP